MPSPGDKPQPRKKPGASPIIRTPPGPRADPANVSERLTGLAHDLASLLDGSLRQISLLMREGPDDTPDNDPTFKRLLSIRTALEQMVVMVTAAARGLSLTPGAAAAQRMNPLRGAPPVMSLADAIQHAVTIMEPTASEHGITLRCAIDPRLDHVDARGLYTVIVNALRNAVESIVRRRPKAVRGRARGDIEVVARAGPLVRGTDEPAATVSIIDDGEGPPIPPPRSAGVARGQQSPDVFAQGYTTKPGSLGIGLSMAHDIVTAAGGRIRLRPSPRADGTGGAELLIELPARTYDTPAGFGDSGGHANAA